MHGNTHGATKKRDYRSIKLATTTRAVRAALALSATMLALSGSGAALAGTCVVNGTTAHCDGVFSNDVTNDYPMLNTIPDLTLIVGSESATTIDPAAGVNGISSVWGGDATVISYAEINTTDANGIYMSTSDGNGLIENQGSIDTYGASTDATAVYGYSYYDIATVNGGDITADTAFGSAYNATGIEVYSWGYNATVTNQGGGSIAAYAYSGDATGVDAYGFESAIVSNAGSIYASSYYNVATGIEADAFGDATVNNSGLVDAYGADGATAIDVYSFAGVATVDGYFGSEIIASSIYSATGITADGYFGADVLVGGSVKAVAGDYAIAGASFEATGVSAYAFLGDATITSSAGIYARVDGYSVYGSVSATGASAVSIVYDALVHNYGDVTAIAVGFGYGSVTALGADTYSVFGDATIVNQNGTLTAIAYGYGYSDGVNAVAAQAYSYYGDAVIDNSGLIRAAATNDQDYSAYFGAQATGASAFSKYGNATVDNEGAVYATARGSDYGYGTYYGAEATGIYAGSITGNVVVNNSGTVAASVVGSPSVNYGSAVGIYGFSVLGSVTIDNDNSVSASGDYASAFGIEAVSLAGAVVVDNSGTIHATSIYDNAIGVETYSLFGDVTVVNSAEVHADSFWETAIGIHAYAAKYGDNVVDNTGLVDAHSTVGFAFGIRAETAYSATYGASVGNIDITNGGTVNAVSDYFLAVGIAAFGYEDISVASSGDINVSAFYYGYGVLAITEYGDITIANGGDITVSGYSNEYFPGKAYGINAETSSGAIAVNNGGSISASGEGVGDYAGGAAYGVKAYTFYGDVTVDNGGTISATGSSEYGLAQAYGIHAIGLVSESVTLTNDGSIAATATGGSDSYYQLAAATGIYTQSFSAYMGVYNDGDITATASVGADTHYASAIATGVNAAGNNYALNIYNGGEASITATASAGSGDLAYDNQADAFGITSYNYFADVNIVNLGSVEATASSGGEFGYANATGITALIGYYGTGSAYVYNGGNVTAAAEDNATGVLVDNDGGYFGSFAGVENNGSISASAIGGDNAAAVGVMMDSYYAIFQNDVDGSILASAVSGYDLGDASATGVHILATYVGYYAYSAEEAGVVFYSGFHNDGSIAAFADGYTAAATGVYLQSYGDVFAYNYGEISAEASGAFGEAVGFTGKFGGDVTLVSIGDIRARSYGDIGHAYGVDLSAYDVYVYNGGGTDAHASGYSAYATAIRVVGDYANGFAGLQNNGGISASAIGVDNAVAVGVMMDSYYAIFHNDVDGSISASALSGSVLGDASATGVHIQATYVGYYAYSAEEAGNVFYSGFHNDGSISASAEGYTAAATGVYLQSHGDVFAYNYGEISAEASGAFGEAVGFTGSFGGDVVLVNLSDIHASASSSDSGHAYGVDLSGYGVLVYSGGDTYAHASGDSAHATAIRVLGYYADIITGPDSYTGAVAEGVDYAVAEAAAAFGSQVNIIAGGALHASADSDMATGDSFAAGVTAFGTYAAYVTVEEGAVITASATGHQADAYGVLELAEYTYFNNYGSISASVDGVSGYAFGARVSSPNQVFAYNYGDISATATGSDTQSVGIVLESVDNSAGIHNGGDIAAHADNIATGVWLASDTIGYVYNYGSITAEGGVHSIAVYSSGLSADYIYNAGDITGGIWTNAGNDKLLNGEDGAWYATDISYFGDGDDAIYNYGVIVMDDSVIDLGFHDVYGNYFFNYGTIAVNGADNVINMGDGPLNSLVPSLNPNPFYNGVGGVIDFQDGAPDDVLTIVGDFAGDGDINVDMSGLDGTSDVLYIDGSVVAGTVGVININMLDLPENIEGLVPVVYVTGNSAAGNFILGDINWDYENPFLTLDVDLVADIDASNATPDVFSLGIEVTGLADAGTLAASVGPSVQSLMNTQVGTWRQRMGVIDSFNKGAIALWARVFSNEGAFQPEHSSSFGSGGNFDWQQKNSGVEAGIDFSVTDEFSIGLLLSKSQADIDLDNDGSGSADLDADTWGIYGTWISPNGFYLDASYRWMNFDVDLHSIAGNMETEGDAEAFNVEAGYAWTLSGGLKIEPQLQYTKTSVNNIDTLVPMTGISFAHDGGDSSRGRLGVAIRKSFGEADTGWLWTPYATLSAVREFDGESVYAINDHFVGGTTVEGTSALLELGFTARHQNWSIYGGLNWEDGGAVDRFFGGQLGVRYTFGGPAPAPVVVVPLPAKTCADLDDDGDGVNNCDDKCLGSTAGQVVGPDGCPVPEPEPVAEPKPFRG